MEPFIELTGIKKNFGGVKALDGMNLTICPGEIHCLAGENGSGKSTIIKIISGYYHPDAGEIRINGHPHQKMTPHDSIKEGIQVIYQDFSLFHNMTVRENLAFTRMQAEGRRLVNRKEMDHIAREAVSKINIDVDLDALVETLPVADKQLVAIARALLDDARLIIMDEPTTALTRKETSRLFEIIRELKARGVSILFVSHKLEEVFEICEYITILRNGKNVISCPIGEMDSEKFSYFMTGRRFCAPEKTIHVDETGVAMELDHVNAAGITDISFILRKGEILGITGQLGSGRTELSLAIFGMNRITSGRILVDGKETSICSVENALEQGIGLVPEDRLTEGLFLSQPIMKNIIAGNLANLLSAGGIVDQKKLEDESSKWIQEIGIVTENHYLPASTLSGGNQQKVVLAKWLSREPKILVLNGPTVGVDIGAKYDIHALLRKCTIDGMSVIIISDDLSEIMAMADRTLVMSGGRIVKELTSDEMEVSEMMVD